MCGRYTLRSTVEEIAAALEAVSTSIKEERARYNIAPGQEVVAARASDDGRELVRLKWGLVPSWAKDPSIGNKLINARSETVSEKPSFREAIKKRRCLIASDGFFEWEKERRGGRKQPYYFRLKDGGVFAFAGLYERWRGDDGREINSCTILTTEANDLLRPVHDRMPVILRRETFDLWLDPDVRKAELRAELFAPYPAEEMTSHPVSALVNRPTFDTPEIINSV